MADTAALNKTIGRVLYFVWRLRWWVLLIQVVMTVSAAMYLQTLPDLYRSTTTIRVDTDAVINPLTKGLAVSSGMQDRVATIRQEIMSPDYMEKIIARLKLEAPDVKPMEHRALVDRMIENTELSITRGRSGTFQISYTDENPSLVRDVTNLLSGIFIEDSLSNKESDAGTAFDFLNDQLEIYRQRLEGSEEALRRFQEQNVEVLPSNRNAYLARLDGLRNSHKDMLSRINKERIKRQMLLESITGKTVDVGDTPQSKMVANPLGADLLRKEAELQDLLRRYSESYPDVAVVRAEIEDLKAQVAAEPMVSIHSVSSPRTGDRQEEVLAAELQQIDLELSSLERRAQQVAVEVQRYEGKVQTVPQMEQELTSLQRDYDVNSNIYQMFLHRLEEARVSQELEAVKRSDIFRILQSAALPLKPYSPNPMKIIPGGIAAGLALCAALVYLIMMRSTFFSDSFEVQDSLGAEVVAAIPRVVPAYRKKLLRIEKGVYALFCTGYAAAVAVFLYSAKIEKIVRAVKGMLP